MKSVKQFCVKEGQKVRLKKWPTLVAPFYKSEADYKMLLGQHVGKLSKRQGLLYAQDRYSLLVIFQAMDAAGKDSAIKHVMSGVNPQAVQVYSFKQPSEEELDHDFLWRSVVRLPERGRIGIFNRSYYEDVLVVRVHRDILANTKLPDEALEDKDLWKHRYRSINDLEAHLNRNGTRILKFYLHVSEEEQRKRLLARIDDPEKNWKIHASDIEERKLWPNYTDAYEKCISATSTAHAPWYIVPADDKENTRLIISQVIVDALDDLKLSYPKVGPQRREELQAMRKALGE